MAACAACNAENGPGARFCSACGTALAPDPDARTRKMVTILFSDLTDFTPLTERLDPESLHAVMSRYFTAMRAVIDRHGGRVEKYIGDAIMAIFGVPRLHEDDAVRAARCALEMREALTALNAELASGWQVTLHAHYGISTGEVAFAPVGAHAFFALGDAVNVAQRLEAVASPDEILVEPQTARLLDGRASLEALAPMHLKGKSAPVDTWRLVGLATARGAPAATAMVGRELELGLLEMAFDDARNQRRCRAVTVLGPAGIGKSCLVRSFLPIAKRSATTVVGRCLSYGEGITFWPLAEVVEQLAGGADEGAIAALLGDDDQARWAAARVARALGFAAGPAPIEEIQLAMRRLLEAVARRRPLVVVVEDIHWAEPTLLDVLEHVVTHARDAPLLVLCLARPELRRRHLAWEVGETVRLGPLTDRDSRRVLDRLDPAVGLDETGRARLLAAAEGNPFFLEQMVAMQQETGAAPTIPPTIQAVLGARIEALPPTERAVLECASVEGRRFHRDVVAELLPAGHRDGLGDALASLVQRDLIRPGGPDAHHDEGYRFSHILVRDEVFALVPLTRRADLHERFARSLERRSVGERELGEIVGFHFEQAYRCSIEVEPAKRPEQQRLALAGSRHLGVVGRAALGRGDVPAAVNLLKRATDLLDDDEPALSWLLPELGSALTQAGFLTQAQELLERAVDRAAARGEARYEAHAVVCLLSAQLQLDVGSTSAAVRTRFPALLNTFEASADDLGLDRLWRLRGVVRWTEARFGAAEKAWHVAVEHAVRAGDEQGEVDALCWLASSAFFGPMPVAEGIARCNAIRADLGDNRRGEAFVMQPLACLHAMGGDFTAAHELLGQSDAMLAELGITMHTAVPFHRAFIALLAGRPAEAEAALRSGYERLRDMGEKALLADTAAMLARAVYLQDHLDEALDLTLETEEGADADDRSPQIGWRMTRAAILTRRGRLDEARRLSAKAVALAEDTDYLTARADALVTHAQVLEACDEHSAATKAARAALALHERKGNVVAAQQLRATLATTPPTELVSVQTKGGGHAGSGDASAV
jgi:class 3 adenylate cyclase/tetratricopeptide (TPR) repeat protein